MFEIVLYLWCCFWWALYSVFVQKNLRHIKFEKAILVFVVNFVAMPIMLVYETWDNRP